MKRSGAIAAMYVGTAVAPYVQRLARDPWLDEADLATLDHLLTDTPLGERTVEFRVWNANREVLYSADRSLIDQHLSQDDGYDSALNGDVTAEMSDLQLDEQHDPGQHFSGVAGLGLGLYISHQIVAMHGGQIAAEFPPGGGTQVIVTLPAQETPADLMSTNGVARSAETCSRELDHLLLAAEPVAD